MTIAQQIKWDFTNGNLEIHDKNGKPIYLERSNGTWAKWEYDSRGNVIYVETSGGTWAKREYDSQGRQNYIEDSDGTWRKWELDSEGKVIYYENSYGEIIDYRPKSCENKVVEIDGVKFKLVKA